MRGRTKQVACQVIGTPLLPADNDGSTRADWKPLIDGVRSSPQCDVERHIVAMRLSAMAGLDVRWIPVDALQHATGQEHRGSALLRLPGAGAKQGCNLPCLEAWSRLMARGHPAPLARGKRRWT